MKALRSSPCFRRVALKLWRESDGRAQVFVEASGALVDDVNSLIAERRRPSTEDQVARDVDSVLAKQLRFPVDGVELPSTFALALDDGEEAKCPSTFSVFVALRVVDGDGEERDHDASEVSDDLFSPFRGEPLIYAAVVDGSPDDLKWAPRREAERIVAVASRAWHAGKGTFGEVADALNRAGLVSLKTAKPFSSSTVTAVLTAVELVDGSADVDVPDP